MFDVALDFKLPPAEIRSWLWADFTAVLEAYARRAEADDKVETYG